jgi:hypothetical protein
MAKASPRPISATDPEPISARAIAAAAEPPPPQVLSVPQLLLGQLRPLLAHGALFLMGLAGGLAVATVSSLTLHYLNNGSAQLAAARVKIPPTVVAPLDVEIQKAKADLDAALANGS